MPDTVYACTFVEKAVNRTSPFVDCYPNGFRTTLAEPCGLTAPTAAALKERLAARFYLDGWEDMYTHEEDGGVTSLTHTQLEDADGLALSPAQTDLWRAGRLPAYMADYWFAVEQREVTPIPASDFGPAAPTFTQPQGQV